MVATAAIMLAAVTVAPGVAQNGLAPGLGRELELEVASAATRASAPVVVDAAVDLGVGTVIEARSVPPKASRANGRDAIAELVEEREAEAEARRVAAEEAERQEAAERVAQEEADRQEAAEAEAEAEARRTEEAQEAAADEEAAREAQADVDQQEADEVAARRADDAVQGRRGQDVEAPSSSGTSGAAASAMGDNDIVDIAFRYVGTPYVWGGTSPSGFDCSGFTWYVYQQAGITIPRSSAGQRDAGQVVPAADARPGDLVWWPGHVGIYLGGGDHIAARNTSKPLQAGPISHVGRGAPTYIRVTG